MGRVSRELLEQFRTLIPVDRGVWRPGCSNNVYFFSSIHWCPDKLPHPSCILIHDVIPLLFPDIFGDISRDFKSRLKFIAQQADTVVAISHSSAHDIARLLDISIDKISVIYNGVTTLPVVEKSSLWLPERFVVYIGSHDRHKNIDVVFRALQDASISDIDLVMIGGNKRAQKIVTALHLNDRVHFLGRLNDGEMGYVIRKALALVFPSLYEGFGLPPLEAAMLGTPSLCSLRPAMSEVMEGVALFASPDTPSEWVRGIQKLRDDALFRNELGLLAKERAESFSWKTCAEGFVEHLTRLGGGGKG